jgi:hypothetical protein
MSRRHPGWARSRAGRPQHQHLLCGIVLLQRTAVPDVLDPSHKRSVGPMVVQKAVAVNLGSASHC